MATSHVPRIEGMQADGEVGGEGRRGESVRSGVAARHDAGRSGAAARQEPGTRTVKGASLARGPALALGTILLAAGLYLLYRQHGFPRFADFPDGRAPIGGKALGIFGANGWTGELTAVAGGLLLVGAAQHLLAKAMSLIVAVALGAAAIIALISGDVLGLAAANHWTELGWAVIAAILLFNAFIPRRRRTITEAGPAAVRDEPRAVAPRDAEPGPATARDEPRAAAPRDAEPAAPAAPEDAPTAVSPSADAASTAASQPADAAPTAGRRRWFGPARH